MASDIGILINIAIVLVLYFGLDTIQSLVFDGEPEDVKPEPRMVQSRPPVRSHYRRGRPSFVTQKKCTVRNVSQNVLTISLLIKVASETYDYNPPRQY